jgi:hypothetical protein
VTTTLGPSARQRLKQKLPAKPFQEVNKFLKVNFRSAQRQATGLDCRASVPGMESNRRGKVAGS